MERWNNGQVSHAAVSNAALFQGTCWFRVWNVLNCQHGTMVSDLLHQAPNMSTPTPISAEEQEELREAFAKIGEMNHTPSPFFFVFFTNMFLKISGSLAPCLPLMHGWCQQLGGFMHVMTWCYVQFLTLSFFFSFFKCLQINFHKDQQDQCWGQPLLNLLLSHSLF